MDDRMLHAQINDADDAESKQNKKLQLLAHNLTQSASEESTSNEDAILSDGSTSGKRDHDIQPMDIVFTGTSNDEVVVEPVTGISYPETLNGFLFIGCGVRTMYWVFHAYTIGLYLDMAAVTASQRNSAKSGDWMKQVLLDPNIPRIFRLVMNRNVTSAQYIGATFDALTPLMRGQHLDKLQEMKKQEMPKMLYDKTEIYLMVYRDTLTLQVGTDRAGKIISDVLTRAVCENYLGAKPVSPATRKAVVAAFPSKTKNLSSGSASR